ncbi:MAG: hypothetical protein K0Q94_6888, partial [Paenibacillus sp.]|nr:hypothetical protein [Paenibacillus sp.]
MTSCHGENDRVLGHAHDVLSLQQSGCGHPDEHVGTGYNFPERSGNFVRIGILGVPIPHRIIISAIRDERALPVDTDQFLDTGREQYFAAGDPRRTDTAYDHFDRIDRFPDELERADQSGIQDDRGTVLIVVKYRNVQLLLQPFFDFEAARGRYIFQIDAAECRGDRFDCSNNFFRILRIETYRKRVDIGQLLEQHCFPFHD